jgi:hypothetical protein
MDIWEGPVMIPAELIVWLLGSIGLFLTFCIHLLIRILSKQTALSEEFRVWQTKADIRLDYLEKEQHK